jgi:hypothetical protein
MTLIVCRAGEGSRSKGVGDHDADRIDHDESNLRTGMRYDLRTGMRYARGRAAPCPVTSQASLGVAVTPRRSSGHTEPVRRRLGVARFELMLNGVK